MSSFAQIHGTDSNPATSAARRTRLALLMTVAWTFATPASLAQVDARLLQQLKPYADAGVSFDSNFFRLPRQIVANNLYDGQGTPSDMYYTLRAGLDGELDVSRQNFIIQGEVFREIFDDFSEQSYTGGTANLLWNWSLADRWTGELGYGYDRARQGYENQTIRSGNPAQPFRRKRFDVRSRQNLIGRANYELTPDWTVYVNTKLSDIRFREQSQLDLQRTMAGAGVDYMTVAGNRIGFNAEVVDGDFEQDAQPDFDEFNFGPTANWEVSGRTRLRGRIAYTSRDFSDPEQEDFDGITWRLTLARDPGELTNTEFSIYRNISTLNDDISNYAVVDGISVAPVWRLSGKTLARFQASYEVRDFRGVGNLNPQAIGLSGREDKVGSVGATLEWEATRAITLSLGYTYEDRSSTREIEEYDYSLIELRVRGGF